MNILIIGTWYHARRIYIPYCIHSRESFGINTIFWLDLDSQHETIHKWSTQQDYDKNINMCYIEDERKLDEIYISNIITRLVKTHNIQAVIISTEPLSHLMYANICLRNNLSILLDKPITLEDDIVNDPAKSDKMLSDYTALTRLYTKKYRAHWLHFDIMSQRRYKDAII